MSYKILVAAYSTQIVTLSFDPTSSPPKLAIHSSTKSDKNPSWIAPHPTDKSLVFAGIELEDAKIQVYRIVGDGKLEFVEEISTGGAGVAHLAVSEHEIIAGNYGGGSVLPIPFSATSPHLRQPIQAPIQFTGNGPISDRQESSHPHQVILHPTREEVLIPDLGTDKIWRLLKDEDGKWVVKGAIDVAPGSGPRHGVIYNDILYTVQELSASITAHHLPPLPEAATLIETLPTLAPPAKPLPDMLAAELLLTTTPTPLLYLSNRNDPSPLGDTISIYTPYPAFSLVAEARSGVKHLRGLAFGGPNDKYMVAGGAFGGGIKIFERSESGLELKEVASLEEGAVECPTGFLWI